MSPAEDLMEVLWVNTGPQQESGCRDWISARTGPGYGSFNTKRTGRWSAHRASWYVNHGDIPQGLVVRHRCDRPSCLAIEHLELGTQKQNVADKMERGRANTPKNERHGNAKLTDEQVADIRRRYYPPTQYGTGRVGMGSVLAKEYGVTRQYITSLVRGKWRKPE